MMKKTKKTIITFLLLPMLIDILPNVYAKTTVIFDESVKETVSTPGGRPATGESTFEKTISANDKRSYRCTWGRWIWDRSTDIISVYDKNNEDIIKQGFLMDLEDYPLAGTAVGLSIKERRERKVSIDSLKIEMTGEREEEVEYVVTEYKCDYETDLLQTLPTLPNSQLRNRPLNPIATPSCETLEKNALSSSECPEPESYCKLKSETPREVQKTVKTTRTVNYGKTYEYNLNDGSEYLVANDQTDAEAIMDCLNSLGDTLSSFANTARVSSASYNILLTNSNDAKSSSSIELEQSKANKTAKHYYSSGEEAVCLNNKCEFNHEESTLEENKVKLGRFYINESDPIINNNRYLAYLITYYTYAKDRTCINVKTGKVRYLTGDNICNEDEFTIKNDTLTGVDDYVETSDYSVTIQNMDEVHWHYFIPLNAKSTDGIKLKYDDVEDSARSKDACLNAMKKYYIKEDGSTGEDYKYTELIKPKYSNDLFVGDYYCIDKCGTAEAVFSDSSIDYSRIMTDGGCLSAGERTITIDQKFYNEIITTNGTKTNAKFEGFNFYYKPIDINNPFPNGKTDNSLWKDWNKTTNNNPNLSKSYDKISYIASNINASDIREYTKENPYISWENMNKNGTSNFITNEGIVTRKETGNTYKLGCGPANEKEYLDPARLFKNPLYIEGCGKP